MITRKLPTKMWAGFCNGRMDVEPFVNESGTVYGVLYTSKAAASRCYQDVRQVEFREVKRVSKSSR